MSEHGQFDMRSALAAGLKRDATGHFPSRVPSGPNEGLILKKRGHPTFGKTVAGEKALGFKFFRKGGRLFTFKKQPDPSFVPVDVK